MATTVVGLHAGRTTGEIAEFSRLLKSLWYQINKRFDERKTAGAGSDNVSVDSKTNKRRQYAIRMRTPRFIE